MTEEAVTTAETVLLDASALLAVIYEEAGPRRCGRCWAAERRCRP